MSRSAANLGKADLADRLGLEFRHTANFWEFYSDPPWQHFVARGFLRNVLQGEWRGHAVRIFDFERHAGDSDSPSYFSTAMCLDSDRIEWPRTSLTAYGQWDQIAARLFGAQRLVPGSKCEPLFTVDSDDVNFGGLIDSRLDAFLRQNGDLEIHLGRGKLAICTCHKHQLDAVELEIYLGKSEELLEIVTTPPVTVPVSKAANASSILVRNQRPRMARLAEVLLLSLIVLCCGFHLHCARQQWNASRTFVETKGWMTRVDLVDGAATTMEYEYRVAGRPYKGRRIRPRFVWRPIQRGDERAQRLVRDWRPGARPAVFYNPKQVHCSVLDNSFTKGDKDFATLLLAICGACCCWIGVRLVQALAPWFKSADQTEQKGCRIRYGLPFAPFTLDFATLLALPLGALAIGWIGTLVSDIALFDSIRCWSFWIAMLQAICLPFLLVVERNWRGADSRWVTVDHQLRLITIPRAGSTPATVEFHRLRSIRLRATERDPETVSGMNGFDPIVTYVDTSGNLQEVVITRFFSERRGRQLANGIQALIDQHVPKELAKPPARIPGRAPGSAARFAEAVTVEQLSIGLMMLAGLMAILLLTRQVEIAIALMVAATVGIAWISLALTLEVNGDRSKWFRSSRDKSRKTLAMRFRGDDLSSSR